jgi:hypothetical protein
MVDSIDRIDVETASPWSVTERYLIAHKVRGEPAFDIAINIGDEEGGDLWIIPTSGHRAYPYWYKSLSEVTTNLHFTDIPPLPLALPDHYQCNDILRKPKTLPATTLEDLI